MLENGDTGKQQDAGVSIPPGTMVELNRSEN